jgi:hypothetical protein
MSPRSAADAIPRLAVAPRRRLGIWSKRTAVT